MNKNIDDFVIVGKGILGLSIAYQIMLSVPEAKIVIIGPDNDQYSASVAAGAMLSTFGEITASDLERADHHLYFDLSYQSGKVWPSFVEELNEKNKQMPPIKLGTTGTTILLNAQGTSMDDTPNYYAMIDALKKYNEPFAEMYPDQVEGLKPREAFRSLKTLHIPHEQYVNPELVLKSLKIMLEQNQQVKFINDKVAGLLLTNNKLEGVYTSSKKIFGKNVILTAGVGTQTIVDNTPCLKGRIPRILAGSGVSFVVDQAVLGKEKIRHVLRTPNRAGACGLHLVPRSDNPDHLFIGAGNMMEWSHRSGAALESIAWVLNGVLKEFNINLGETSLISLQHGLRPYSLDGFPLFGQAQSIPGLWFFTGTGRDGFHCAPLLSIYAREAILNDNEINKISDEARNLFTAFAPERPLKSTVSREQSIDLAWKNTYCLLHETGGEMTTGLHVPFPEWIKRDIMEIYEELETDVALHQLVLMPLISRRFDIQTVKKYLAESKAAWQGSI